MKLNTKYLRYLTAEDWRVLTAVEMGSKNHQVVPTTLIIQLSSLRSGSGVHKSISTLVKANLIARMKNAKYDGYRLTYGGLDYLSLHAHLKRNSIHSLGSCIGTGKESDIYICAPPPSPNEPHKRKEQILKIHRLGRTSFRTIKNNRDYLHQRQSASWMYMSRLSAQKEFIFMKALHEYGFRVPKPIAWNRHAVVMSMIEGVPLRAVREVGDPAALYAELVDIVMKLASSGLIHGDFNEFNIMIEEKDEVEQGSEAASNPAGEEMARQDGKFVQDGINTTALIQNLIVIPWIIDFPQAISIDHANAEFYFNRDIQCIKTFFERRFHFMSTESGPLFKQAKEAARRNFKAGGKRLDVEAEASGFSRKMAKQLEKYMWEVGVGQELNEDEGRGSENSDGDEVGDETSGSDELMISKLEVGD